MGTRLLLAAVAATASLAACGADDPEPASAGKGPSAENRKAMLDYARCMRENGVDMPDPTFDGGRVTMRQNRTDEGTMRTADKACAKFRDSIKPPELSDERKEEFKQAALKHSRCMREHGIDMPDPTFDENGGAQMRIEGNLNPESAKFKAAQKACPSGLGGGPSTTDVEGGER